MEKPHLNYIIILFSVVNLTNSSFSSLRFIKEYSLDKRFHLRVFMLGKAIMDDRLKDRLDEKSQK